MPKPYSFGKVELDVGLGREASGLPDPETPFRILLLGDFSGRANRGVTQPKLGERRPLTVDRDNFDQVMARVAPQLHLPVAGSTSARVAFRFAELDDFHPDRIFEHSRVFQVLREMRNKVNDPATFSSVAAELGARSQPEMKPPVRIPSLSSAQLFDEMLEQTESRQGTRPAPVDDWTRLVHEIVAPYVVPKPDPKQGEMLNQVDAAISGQMRAVLHQPAFQALEAAWRAVWFLARRLETGKELKLYVLDVAKEELAADLAASDDLRASGMYRILVEQSVGTPGGQPWAVVAGNYSFENTPDDLWLLGRIGKIATAAGAPFLAEAGPSTLEASSVTEHQTWELIRHVPQSRYLGLALPRFLLRLPYGKETDSVELFDFEEMAGKPSHEEYLWANPAFACVELLGRAFSQNGWQLQPGSVRDIGGLPVHIYREDGEPQAKPCAEVLLTDRAAEAIMDKGIMPLLSMKDGDTVRLARFQSLADPPAGLAGRWAAG